MLTSHVDVRSCIEEAKIGLISWVAKVNFYVLLFLFFNCLLTLSSYKYESNSEF